MNFSSRPSRLRNEWAPSVPRELLIGVMQIIFGLCRMGMLIRFVSSSVRTGFVNALAVPIFSAQLPHVWSARLRIIALPALTIAMVGLQESVLTAAVIDDMAGTPGTQNHECTGPGPEQYGCQRLWRYCGPGSICNQAAWARNRLCCCSASTSHCTAISVGRCSGSSR